MIIKTLFIHFSHFFAFAENNYRFTCQWNCLRSRFATRGRFSMAHLANWTL